MKSWIFLLFQSVKRADLLASIKSKSYGQLTKVCDLSLFFF